MRAIFFCCSFLLAAPVLAEDRPQPAPASAPDDQERDLDVTEKVTGTVSLRCETVAADVTVTAGAAGIIKVHGEDVPGQALQIVSRGGNRYELMLDGRSQIRRGHLQIALPASSEVDVGTTSGDVSTNHLGGAARVRTVAGDVHLVGVANVDIKTVSGEVKLEQASGEVRLRTVSGDTTVATTGKPDAQLEYSSTSGDLSWTGACKRGCRIEGRTVSGEVALKLDPASSFVAHFVSHSGDMQNQLGAKIETEDKSPGGTNLRARLGSGEGTIDVESFSGDLTLSKR